MVPLKKGSSTEVLCRVCGDKASGKHYGVSSCDGCRGFFKRSIRRLASMNLDYVCKENGNCIVDVTRRNQCQSCRFKKCLQVNMKREAVQHERASRSTAVAAAAAAAAVAVASASGTPSTSTSNPFNSAMGLRKPFFPIEGLYSTPFHPGYYSQNLGYPAMSFKPCLGSGPPSSLRIFPETFVKTNADCGSSKGSESSKEDDRQLKNEDKLPEPENSSSLPVLKPRPTPFINVGYGGGGTGESGGEDVCNTTAAGGLSLFNPPFQSDNVYESAAKLLFMVVKWARSIPSFLQINSKDQNLLLEEAWSQLFVLGVAQWGIRIDEFHLIKECLASSSEEQSLLVNDVRNLKEIVTKISSLQMDHTEYTCLKALVLFRPEIRGLTQQLQIEILQDQTHLMLQEYCQQQEKVSTHTLIPKPIYCKTRFGKLLLTLPSLNKISAKSVESLFFRKTVGNIAVERVISDLFQ